MHCDSHCVTRSICPRLIWMEKKKEDEANIYKEMEQVGKMAKKFGANWSNHKEPTYFLSRRGNWQTRSFLVKAEA